MGKKLKIIIDGDSSGAKKAVAELERSISRLEKAKAKIANPTRTRSNFNDSELRDYKRISKQIDAARLANHKAQIKQSELASRKEINLAQESARRVTAAKKSELKQFENAEKSKQRIAEVSARGQIKSAELASRQIESARQREYREFVRTERLKEKAVRDSAKNRFNAQKLSSTGKSIQGVGVAATAAVSLPIIGALAKAIELGSQYEDSMNLFQETTQATAEEMKKASAEAIKLGNDITLPGVSAKDASDAMTALAKSGLSAKEAIEAANGTMRLAKAANIEAAEAAEIQGNALNAFKLPATEAGRVADLLASAANSASGEVTDMADALKQSGAVFSAANVPIEDAVTAIGLLANNGIKGSDAGTSLKSMMLKLQAPSSAAAKTMKSLGIEIFDSQGKMKSMREIIGTLSDKTSGLTEQQKAQALATIFGSDAIRSANILIKEGTKGYDEMSLAVQRANAAQKLSEARTKGVAGAWDAFTSQLETIALQAFLAIKDPLKEILLGTAQFAEKLSAAFGELPPGLQQLVVILVGILAAIGPVLVIVGTLIVAFGALASAVASLGGLTIVATVIIGIGGAIAQLAIPIGIAIAYAYLLYRAYQENFGGIKDFVDDVFQGIKGFITNAMSEIGIFVISTLTQIRDFWQANGEDITKAAKSVYDFLASVVKAGLDAIRSFWSANGETIKTIASAIWENIKTIVSAGINIVLNIIKLVAAVINGDWSKAWDAAKQIIKSAISIIGSILSTLWTIVKNAFKLAYTAIISAGTSLMKAAYDIGANIVTGLANGISNLASSVYNKAKEVASNALGMIKGVFIQQSPSKATFKIGEFVSEGLALGIESKIGRVKNAAKKVATETLKTLREAAEKFQSLSGLGAKQVQQKVATDQLNNLTSSLEEIIKLRGELGFDLDISLPSTKEGIEKEIQYLTDFKQLVSDIGKEIEDTQAKQIQKAEDYKNLLEDIRGSADSGIIDLREEQQLLRVVDNIEKQRIQNHFDLVRLREQMNSDGFTQNQIDHAEKLQQLENARYLTQLQLLEKRKQIKAAEDYGFDLEKQLEDLRNVNVELSVYEETLRKIETDFKNISPGQKEYLLDLAKNVDLLTQMRQEHTKLKESLREIFRFAIEGDFKGLLKSFGDRIKVSFIDKISDLLATKILGFDPNQTDNPVAKPIVKNIDKTNKLLANIDQNIAKASGGTPSLGGIGNIGGILQSLAGGLFGSSSGPGAAAHEAGNIGFGGNQSNANLGGFDLGNILGIGGSGSGGGFIDNIKNIFSGKDGTLFGKGGIFGDKGFGNNVGTYGAVGSIAGLLGGLLGGKAGSVISGAGSGVAIGASIGSIIPGIGTAIGAVIGGAIGFFSSLFGSPKRKRDKNENMPALEQGFTEAIKQLKDIAGNKNAILNDPFGTLKQAEDIRDEVANGFGIRFESKKYRRIASQKISQKTAEANVLVDQIAEFAEKAKAANETDSRLVAQFAGGVFMDAAFRNQYHGFKRRNGMLPGAYSKGDVLPSLLAGQEMVINPNQQMNIIRNAGGFDVFEGAGIPGYAEGKAPTLKPVLRTSSVNSPSSDQPIVVKVYNNIENSGMVESDVESVVENSLGKDSVQVEIYKGQKKVKTIYRDR